MKPNARIFGILFVVLSVLETVTLSLGVESIHPWIKPLLIPTLAAAALCALLPEHRGRQTVLLAIGMALHTAGDVLLMFDSRGFAFFAAGLAAFLLGHFCYIFVLLHKMGGLRGVNEIFTWVVPLLIVYPIISFFEVEGTLRIVLAVYALTLLFLIATGVLWLLRGRKLGWRVIAGGLFFIASDAILALKVFNGVDFPLRHAAVMGTYLLAEWLLVSAMVRYRQTSEAASAK
jgi:uncharacterized membrane protein YhhN